MQLVFLCGLLSLTMAALFFPPGLTAPVNGGVTCAACTVMVGMTEQFAQANNVSVVELVSQQLCQMFPGQFNFLCSFLVTAWGPAVVEKLINNESPDVICYSLGICHLDPNQGYCHLFPVPPGGFPQAVEQSRRNSKIAPPFSYHVAESLPDACHLPGIQQVCDALANTFGSHIPAVDLDRDKFSVIDGFRGAFWRGRDCDDVNEFIYPGRKPLYEDYVFDSNCNGISGVNPLTGATYERELCGDGDQQRGVIYIGDSVGARFHVPIQWFTPSLMNREIFQNMTSIVSNQFDWPHMSFATGFDTVDWPILSGTADSIYTRLRERNLCNHRDYQNICFNGATTGTMKPFLKSISRHQQHDKPALVFYALVGNDVCQRHQDDPTENTRPEEFREHVIESLQYLNANLPNGSHVVLMGLVDGGFIFPTMGHRLHPMGQLNGDVTYADIYDWWNCMHIGPCYGWMNRNETFRNATTKRAEELTSVLEGISTTVCFESIKLHFIPNPLQHVLNKWEEMGHEAWTALEPVDSMHPVQELQALITDFIWETITTQFPEALGSVNPKNEIIRQLFEDQGGH